MSYNTYRATLHFATWTMQRNFATRHAAELFAVINAALYDATCWEIASVSRVYP